MDDKDVQVQFRAVVGDFLSGLKEATDSVRSSTDGMKGDVGALSETIGKMGTTALVLGGVGLAFEGIKKATEFIVDATRETNELADSFEDLGYATGASLDDLNAFMVAIELSGGKVGDLTGLFVGMQRGIRANSEYLIANGVAANKAALEGMSFEEYLRKVHEISEQMAEPSERAQFLIEAMGRSGATSGNQIRELVENLDKAREITEKNNIVTQQSMEQANATEESIGRLKAAQQAYAATVSANATPVMNWWRDFRTAIYTSKAEHEQLLQMAHAGFIKMDVDQVHEEEGWKRMRAAADAYYRRIQQGVKDALESSKDYMDAGGRNVPQGSKRHPVEPDKDKPKGKASGSHGDPYADEIAARQKALNTISQIEDKAQKERVERAKQTASAETADAKFALDMQKLNLEQAVDAGQITRQQELAELKKIREQELQIDLAALQKELDVYQGSLVGWRKLQDQMVALKHKAAMDMKKIDNEMAKEHIRIQASMASQSAKTWKSVGKSMSDALKGSLASAIMSSKTLADAANTVMRSVAEAALQTVIDLGVEELKTIVTTAAAHKAASSTKVAENAAEAGTAGMKSAAEIPYIGWAIAIGAGLAIFAAASQLSSAEGGFDIPAGVNPLTQLHAREMVLPAEHADTIRNLEGKGASPKIYISAVDARGVERVLRRNQGTLIKLGNEAARNNRRRA